MTIPGDLVVLLERMFARKVHNNLVMPDPRDRIKIYRQALAYVEKDLRLFSYVLGHRRQVTYGTCRRLDDVILECAYRDPRIIPADFRERMPRGSYTTPMLERLYIALRTVQKFDYEECLDVQEAYALAAE